ncbi:MAG: 4Fe-4S dicluster-binding protein [Candidatus Aquicultorales bacterium]
MKWNIEGVEGWTWTRHPAGGAILEAGNAHYYKTGGWRTHRPTRNEKCNQCLQCWVFCPDTAVLVENEEVVGFDLDHCKGCGICSEVCAVKAISMVEEQAGEGSDE